MNQNQNVNIMRIKIKGKKQITKLNKIGKKFSIYMKIFINTY